MYIYTCTHTYMHTNTYLGLSNSKYVLLEDFRKIFIILLRVSFSTELAGHAFTIFLDCQTILDKLIV